LEKASARESQYARADSRDGGLTMRQASVLVADEVTYTLNGKLNLFGVYTDDIVIPTPTVILSQLIFVFIVETETDDPFMELRVQVALPSGQMTHMVIPVNALAKSLSDEIRWNIRMPVLFNTPMLSPGVIIAKAIHERGEIVAVAPVIRAISPRPPDVPH
jgi:hypothetical protein